MKLNNSTTSANESLAVRSSVLAELRDSLTNFSPFAHALLELQGEDRTETLSSSDTYFKTLWNSIQTNNGISGTIGITETGEAKVLTLSTRSATDINQGNVIVDYYYIEAQFAGTTSLIATQTDRYNNVNGGKGDLLNTTIVYAQPDFLSEDEIEAYLESFSQQLGSIDILTALSNMAISGPVSYADVMAVLGSASDFVDAKLHGIVSQYATYLNPDNACTIINYIINDYFDDIHGYYEENDTLKFNSMDYKFDSSCLLGWQQVVGIAASAIAVVAAIFNPVASLIAGALGGIISSVGDFLQNNDPSVPRVVPEAAHNIASLPVWQGTATYNSSSWAHRFIKHSGRVTLTTDYFKLFIWLSTPTTMAMEMYVNTSFDFNIVEQWRRGAQGLSPQGSVIGLRSLLQFSTNDSGRNFQTVTFPDADGSGAWLAPDYLGSQSIPSDVEKSDISYSRIYNGLFLCSLYVLYSLNDSITVVQGQTRSNSLPDSYTTKDRLLWYMGAYLDTYAHNLIESSMATWLVPGWFQALKDVTTAMTPDRMLNRFTNSYFSGSTVYPSIVRQDYGKTQDIRAFLTPTITAKGSAMIIPPESRYSIGQKLAITAGVAAAISVATLVASVKFRSLQARNAQNQRLKVNAAYETYKASPTVDNWNSFCKEIKTFNRWTFFNGASRVSAANWGATNTSTYVQSAAACDTSLSTLLKTDAVSDTVTNIADDAIPSLRGVTDDVQQTVDTYLGDDKIPNAINEVVKLIKGPQD